MHSVYEMADMYANGMSLQGIANSVGYKSAHSVRDKLLSIGIQMRSKAGSKNSNLVEDYFSILDTEKKAYFAGLLLADGSVNIRSKSQPQIRIELTNKDSYILEDLRTELRLENEVRPTLKDCCALSWHSQFMFDSLARYGVVPNKTNTKVLHVGAVQEDMQRHFIRGFFDGNGHVSIKGSRIVVGFSDGELFLRQLQNHIHAKLNIPILSVYTSTSYGSKFIEYGTKEHVQSILNYMYTNATTYLKRKYNKVSQVYANIEVGT